MKRSDVQKSLEAIVDAERMSFIEDSLQSNDELAPSMKLFCSSVIRQKDESQNGYFNKTKRVKFSEKRTLLTP